MKLTPLLLFPVVLPALFPLAELAAHPAGWLALAEADRFPTLLLNTLALAAGAVLLAVPAGTLAALVLERGGVRGAAALRAVAAVGLFVPLPVYAAGWLSAFPAYSQGLLPAVCVHAAAGLPWVVWVVSLSLRTADRDLEDDAILAGGSRAVARRVWLPRAAAGAVAAGCWVAVQTFTETAVTDLMVVRTFGEEVYFQLVGNPAGVAAAVAVTVPAWGVAVAVALLLVRAGRRVEVPSSIHPVVSHKPASLPATMAVWVAALAFVGVPLAGLIGKVGRGGELLRVARVHGGTLADSLLWAAVAGTIAAALALVVCRAARESRAVATWLAVAVAVCAMTPAPVVGLGLKQLIDCAVALEDAALAACDLAPEFPPVRSALYDQPSPLPAVWAWVVRFFPVAVVVVWPAVRRLPDELLATARLDAGRRGEWRGVVWPGTRAVVFGAAVAVGVLSLGEVVAGKLVQPPGRQAFAQELFSAMHYGAEPAVAAMCLLQIAATAAACALFALASRRGSPHPMS